MWQRYMILIVVALMLSCGNRRSPTGGPIDDVLPEIVYTIPLLYEQVENNEIVITFSKAMDKTSVINGMVISPFLLDKKLSWKKNSLHILFTEELPYDTNILVYLNKSIRCERNNALGEHMVLTFRNGTLQDSNIAGYITFEDNDMSDIGTQISILDKDSLLVFNREVIGSNYSFGYLNPGWYSLRAFIDLHNNQRYNFGIDPFFSTSFELPISDLIDINLVIADTVKPNIKMLSNPFNNQVVLDFNKELAQMPFVRIVEDSTSIPIQILHQELRDHQLHIVTAPLDTLRYRLQIGEMLDSKGNKRETISTHFDSKGLPDLIEPKVLNTNPRNGSVIYNLTPDIYIFFNKIMFPKDVYVSLKEVESGMNIPIVSTNVVGFTLQYLPQIKLKEFNSYQITLHKETRDISNNGLEDDIIIQFIVIGEE